jgi:tRNA A37 threonylcarbamoyladenosine biosynthesis protein TsaE
MDLDLGELVEDSAVALVEWGEIGASVFGREVMTVDFVVSEDDARCLVVGGALGEERNEILATWATS